MTNGSGGGDDEQVQLTGKEARAGAKLGVMRYVLGISMALVIAIFLVIIMRPFG